MIDTIDFSGVELAQTMRDTLRTSAENTRRKIVVFKDDNSAPATVYANRIAETAPSAGFIPDIRAYPETRAEFEAILETITAPILTMHPLPAWISSNAMLNLVGPDRDAEGAHALHAGALAAGHADIVPPTAKAAFLIAEHLCGDLKGKTVTVVGASPIVGRPLALLLIDAQATVRVAQAATLDLASETRDADIVIAAAGVPGLICGSTVRKGAVCIDVGITRVGDRILGDFDVQTVRGRAAYLTAVPDGVGPVTVACLFENAAKLAARL